MSRTGTGEPMRDKAGKGASGVVRAARLKAALRANLGRRKAQARSRARDDTLPETDTGPDRAGDTSPVGNGGTGTD